MSVPDCPNCARAVDDIQNPEIGMRVRCKSCGVELVIVWLHPIELDIFYGVEDDFGDDFIGYQS